MVGRDVPRRRTRTGPGQGGVRLAVDRVCRARASARCRFERARGRSPRRRRRRRQRSDRTRRDARGPSARKLGGSIALDGRDIARASVAERVAPGSPTCRPTAAQRRW